MKFAMCRNICFLEEDHVFGKRKVQLWNPYKPYRLWWPLAVFSHKRIKPLSETIRFPTIPWCDFTTCKNINIPCGIHGSRKTKKAHVEPLWTLSFMDTSWCNFAETPQNILGSIRFIMFPEMGFAEEENIIILVVYDYFWRNLSQRSRNPYKPRRLCWLSEAFLSMSKFGC